MNIYNTVIIIYPNLFLSSVPRNHDQNTVLGSDFDIELGNTADEVRDDPGEHNAHNAARERCKCQKTSSLDLQDDRWAAWDID